MSQIQWSPDQTRALDALKTGKSLFLTGGAGTGKSTLIKSFCKGRKFARLATTGAAAVLIKGQTVHSFFGLPNHIHRPGDIREGRREINYATLRRIATFEGVLIDETSMLRVDQFQAIIETLGLARNMRNGKPFQLVCVGDFAQLDPVATHEEARVLRASYGSDFYAFEHPAWASLETHELSVIHRQAGDSVFASWLAGVRHGEIGDLDLINARVKPAPDEAVRLVPTNAGAAEINDARMDALPGRDVVLRGRLSGDFNPKNVRVPEAYRMRQGARVIICKNNVPGGYVNGSMGTLLTIGMTKKGELAAKVHLDVGRVVTVKEGVWEQFAYTKNESGDYEPTVKGTYRQMPLLPGWAITIHRSQGMSLDSVHADPRGLFAAGQAYVALSRATSLSGLTLEAPVSAADLYPHPKVARYHQSLKGRDEADLPFTM